MKQLIIFKACETLSGFITDAVLFTDAYPEYDVWYVVGQLVHALQKRNALNMYHLWKDFEDQELAAKFEAFWTKD